MQNEEKQAENTQDFPFETPAATKENLGTVPVAQNQPPFNPQASQMLQVPPQPSAVSTPPPPEASGKPGKFNKSALLKILVGLLVICFILLIAIFVFTKLTDSKQTESPSLTFWGFQDQQIVDSVISDFEKQNPQIKVTYEKQEVNQYKDRVIVRSQNGNGPDVFLFQNTWTPMLLDFLAPVPQNVITSDQFAKTYYPVALNDLVKGGAIYGVPYNIDTLMLYVNKDVFESAGQDVPSNWNDFVDTCRRLTVKDENGSIKTAGCAFGTYNNINHAPDIISLLLLQNGVDILNIESNQESAESAFTFYTSFATESDNVWDTTMEPSLAAFSKGSLAMYFGYSSDYPVIRNLNPSLNMQILPVPQLSQNQVNLANYWAIGISVQSKFQKEAMQFVQFMSKPEVLQKLYQEEVKKTSIGELFPRTDMADNLKTSFLYASILQAPYAKSSVFTDTAGDNGINADVNAYLKNAIEAMDEGSTFEEISDDFSQGISETLGNYGY